MTTPNEMHRIRRVGIALARFGRLALMTLLGLALPVCLIATNVWYITNSEWLYSFNWWRNDIPARSGLPVAELNSGADQIKAYFNDDSEYLDLRVMQGGQEVSLYSQREIDHMVDVKSLMQGVRSAMTWAGLVSILVVAVMIAVLRRAAVLAIDGAVWWSVLGTGAVVAVVGVISAINFTWLFTQFHFISFANDLWQLNPFTDYLLIMFPERFFLEATIFIAAFTLIQFAVLYAVIRFARRRLTVSPVVPSEAEGPGAGV